MSTPTSAENSETGVAPSEELEEQNHVPESPSNSEAGATEAEGDTKSDKDQMERDEEEKERRWQMLLAMFAKYYTDDGEFRVKQRETAESTTLYSAPEKFTILSWNLDGLDDENLKERTEDVIDTILQKNPAVVFFQELIPRTYIHIFRGLSSKYLAIPASDCPPAGYHTATFLNFTQVRHLDHYIKPFPNSTMGRNLLVTKIMVGQIKLALLNTHLESLLPSSDERKAQLKTCFQVAQSFPPDFNVLFGGDLNVREWEPNGLIPGDMSDLWEENGSWPSVKFTWDLTKNTNKQIDCKHQPRKRFDRFYFRSSFPPTINSTYFGLAGTKMVPETESFPSDHFAIVTSFRFAKKVSMYYQRQDTKTNGNSSQDKIDSSGGQTMNHDQ